MPTAAKGQTALVTGASSGIGEALAEVFAEHGFDLVLVARSADKLATLAQRLDETHAVRCHAEPADLALPGAAASLAARLRRQRRRIDVLVNCAGVLENGAFVDIAPTRHQQLIDLNISALTAMITEFLPAMVKRGSGRVLNVASVAAFQPVPTLATYAATKAYVLSLTESLAEELEGTGVTITALCPGVTETPMVQGARDANAQLGRLPRFAIGSAAEVARAGCEACLRGVVICVPGLLNQAATATADVTPRWLKRRVAGAMSRRLR